MNGKSSLESRTRNPARYLPQKEGSRGGGALIIRIQAIVMPLKVLVLGSLGGGH